MARVKVKAKELFDGEISWLSLVKRGANRLPIKILKSEEDVHMGIDLGSTLFRKRDGEAATPVIKEMTIAAVVIRKDEEATEQLIEKVKSLGFDVDNRQEDDESIILKQVSWDGPEDQMVAMRLNDDLGVILGGTAKKFFDPFSDSMSFIENVGSKGFFPGVQMASEALLATTMGIMRNSEDRKDAAVLIEKALDDHKTFVMALTKSLPKVAFKLEDLDRFEVMGKIETTQERAANEGYEHLGCPPGETRGDDGVCMPITVGAEENAAVVDTGTSSDTELNPAVAKEEGCKECGGKSTKKSPGNPDENNANLSGARDCPDGQHLVDGRCVALETGDTSEGPPPVGTGAGQLGAETGEMLKALNKITETMGALMDKLVGLTGKVEKLEKDASNTQDRLKDVDKDVKAARKAVEGTALVGADRGTDDSIDGMHADPTRKKEVKKGFWGGTQMDKMLDPAFTADLRSPSE